MVMLTFDDEVSVYNFPYFRKLFTKGRNNPNGCPIKGTFFVSGVATDFSKVRELYKRGHEIASHSKSHRFPHSWWAAASYEDYKDEIEGMRKQLVKKAGIPYRDIKGMRVPFLQIGGDNQYKMLQDYGYMYDSSMLTGHLFRDKRPPLWPFTLDYPIDWKYSSLEPRPSKSYRGLSLKKLSQMDDVWVVSVSQVVEWTRHPTPISELNSFGPFQC
ncbi:chitin deacetylase 7-like [Liolophura sinensis]|uniref:chitin deacetylase 7-like n=1 Tax=Liolophura sinensis TaxID=3198878 RepID=UPI003158F59B